MKYNIYSIRDVLNGFGVPMCDFNDSSAIRNFKNAFINADFIVGDYDLFRIGSFDVSSGVIVPEEYPVLVYRGTDVRKEDPNGN